MSEPSSKTTHLTHLSGSDAGAWESVCIPFMKKALVLDLEIHPEEDRLLKIGAINGSTTQGLRSKGTFDPAAALDRVAQWGKSAEYLLGHNLAEHDLPWIATHTITGSDLVIYML
jgi:hypothetical protein